MPGCEGPSTYATHFQAGQRCTLAASASKAARAASAAAAAAASRRLKTVGSVTAESVEPPPPRPARTPGGLVAPLPLSCPPLGALPRALSFHAFTPRPAALGPS